MRISMETPRDYGRATRPSGLHDVLESQRAERYQAGAPPLDYWEPSPRAVKLGWRTSLLGFAVFGFFCTAPWVMVAPRQVKVSAGCIAVLIGVVAIWKAR